MKIELNKENIRRIIGYADMWNADMGDYGFTSPEEYALHKMKRELTHSNEQ